MEGMRHRRTKPKAQSFVEHHERPNDNDDGGNFWRDGDDDKYHGAAAAGAGQGAAMGWYEYLGEYVSWFYAMLPSWSAFSQLLRYGPAEEAFELTEEMQTRVDRFKVYIAVAWDENEPEHLAELQRYWALCFPGEEFQRRDKRWTDAGFQGPDPGTDFRGAGVYGLRQLIYLAERQPDNFARYRESDYPFSIAGLNITMMIYSLLGWGFKKVDISNAGKRVLYEYLFGVEDRGDRFERLYCRAMQLLDDEWRLQNASYMMFPIVLKSVQDKFIGRLLEFCVASEDGNLIQF